MIMRTSTRLLLGALALYLIIGGGGVAQADTAAVVQGINNHCHVFTLCDAEDTTGSCTGTTAITADLRGRVEHYISAHDSSATFVGSCDMFTSAAGHSATIRTQVNTTSITEVNWGLPGRIVGDLEQFTWMVCTVTTSTVTINVTSCLPR